jgi:hypothetical protein
MCVAWRRFLRGRSAGRGGVYVAWVVGFETFRIGWFLGRERGRAGEVVARCALSWIVLRATRKTGGR